ncbi:flagellar hook-length control protein FliK [Algibacillus agarilyticus]|uniref:flagellar hook-length control protein FliK n=1 Tax=Algibacillus agarilyticus TaxID=2234133 RepID=UPI000DD057EA|nr:flagellar hook-length control protein FliK [Algibacillus agarilyticus]
MQFIAVPQTDSLISSNKTAEKQSLTDWQHDSNEFEQRLALSKEWQQRQYDHRQDAAAAHSQQIQNQERLANRHRSERQPLGSASVNPKANEQNSSTQHRDEPTTSSASNTKALAEQESKTPIAAMPDKADANKTERLERDRTHSSEQKSFENNTKKSADNEKTTDLNLTKSLEDDTQSLLTLIEKSQGMEPTSKKVADKNAHAETTNKIEKVDDGIDQTQVESNSIQIMSTKDNAKKDKAETDNSLKLEAVQKVSTAHSDSDSIADLKTAKKVSQSALNDKQIEKKTDVESLLDLEKTHRKLALTVDGKGENEINKNTQKDNVVSELDAKNKPVAVNKTQTVDLAGEQKGKIAKAEDTELNPTDVKKTTVVSSTVAGANQKSDANQAKVMAEPLNNLKSNVNNTVVSEKTKEVNSEAKGDATQIKKESAVIVEENKRAIQQTATGKNDVNGVIRQDAVASTNTSNKTSSKVEDVDATNIKMASNADNKAAQKLKQNNGGSATAQTTETAQAIEKTALSKEGKREQVAESELTVPLNSGATNATNATDGVESKKIKEKNVETKAVESKTKNNDVALQAELSAENAQLGQSITASEVKSEGKPNASAVNASNEGKSDKVTDLKERKVKKETEQQNGEGKQIKVDFVEKPMNTELDATLQEQAITNSLVQSANERSAQDAKNTQAQVIHQVNRSEVTLADKSLQKQMQTLKEVPLHDKQASAETINENVKYLINSRVQSAEIRLDPPELGQMQIKINMNGDQASVSIVVQNPQAKEMLDQAVPRLREMLENAGIQLGESNIEQRNGQQAKQGQGEQGKGKGSGNEQAGTEQNDDNLGAESKIINGHLGEVDYYA